MEKIKIFYQNVPLNSALAEQVEGQIDLPDIYAEWFKKYGDQIEVIERQFRTSGPLPGLDGGYVIMSVAIFYRTKNADKAGQGD